MTAERDALAELVACEDLRERWAAINPCEPGCEKEILLEEWRKRKPAAWAAARAALAAQPEQHIDGRWCADLSCGKCYSADFRFRHAQPEPSVDRDVLRHRIMDAMSQPARYAARWAEWPGTCDFADAALNVVWPMLAAQPDNDQSGGGATAAEQAKAEKAGVASGTPDPTAAPAQGEPTHHLTRDEQAMLGKALRASARKVTAQGEPMTAPPREPVAWMVKWKTVAGTQMSVLAFTLDEARFHGQAEPIPLYTAPPVAQPAEMCADRGFAGPSCCTLPRGHVGEHKYGAPTAQPAEPPATDARMSTHWETCATDGGPRHWDCAQLLIERQAREIAELQANFDGLDAASTAERRMTHNWRQRAERAEAERDVWKDKAETRGRAGCEARAECEKLRAMVNALLNAADCVLCDPDGRVCISGSNADRAIMQAAIDAARAGK